MSRRKQLEEDAALSPRLIALHEDAQIQNVCASTTMTSQPYFQNKRTRGARAVRNTKALRADVRQQLLKAIYKAGHSAKRLVALALDA